MSEGRFAVELSRAEGYALDVDFLEEGLPVLRVDEGPPLGGGTGPSPTRLLAAAVGSCLSASLLFCLERARIDVRGLHTRVEGSLARNEQGRLRVESLHITLEPVVDPSDRERMKRCLGIFEDFCTVGRSVAQGIPLEIEVSTGVPPEPALA